MKNYYFCITFFICCSAAASDLASVGINLQAFSPEVGDISARITINPSAKDIGLMGEINRDMVFVDDSNTEESILEIPKDKPFIAYDSIMKSTYQAKEPGNVFLYPFDKAEFYIKHELFYKTKKMYFPAKFKYVCGSCEIPGFNVKIVNQKSNSLEFIVSRNFATKFFSVFINFAFFVMGVTVFILAAKVWLSHQCPPIGTMGFIASLMFAIPLMRSIEPSAPPIGTAIDYIFLFPSEMLVILSLVIVQIFWIKRGGSYHADLDDTVDM
ncbi:DUF4436 family protein [Burkholderia sp. BCC0322]|uniref:DUF4436 family protein n=1 Tax=Burkholderia sp. BCC0322 TaxID=2676296 RepID=UPI00158BEA91|nr:DUF4436 family protein [Burkholderia sp. BCC0322]